MLFYAVINAESALAWELSKLSILTPDKKKSGISRTINQSVMLVKLNQQIAALIVSQKAIQIILN